jgi:peptidoglycan hydrolase-like protein with peptidoglycan-binding domain
VQRRTAADVHAPIVHSPLTSPRFATDALLQSVAADQGRLSLGDEGPSVEAIQQGLKDSGVDPGKVDGKYGERTAAAVRAFKASNALGFTQFGDVGPGTIGKLDLLFPPSGPPKFCPFPPQPAKPPQVDITANEDDESAVVADRTASFQGPVQTQRQVSVGPKSGIERQAPPAGSGAGAIAVDGPEPGGVKAAPLPAVEDAGCVDPPKPGPVLDPPKPQPDPNPPRPEPSKRPIEIIINIPGNKADFSLQTDCPITEPPRNAPMGPTEPGQAPFTSPLGKSGSQHVDVSFVKNSDPFWDHKDANALADQIAGCYLTRKATEPFNPKVPIKNRSKADLQADFDDVADAGFTRSSYGVPFHAIGDRLTQTMTNTRGNLERGTIKDPGTGTQRKRTEDEVAAALTDAANKERNDVADVETIVAWGWMLERRQRLDAESIRTPAGGTTGKPAALTISDDQRHHAERDEIALRRTLSADEQTRAFDEAAGRLGKKPEKLTSAERSQAIETFKLAHPLNDVDRDATLNAKAKALGKDKASLTPQEQQDALDEAVHAKVQNAAKSDPGVLKSIELRANAIAEGEAGNLQVLTTTDFDGWQPTTVPMHKGIIPILAEIERLFGKFSAGTYGDPRKGTHGSSGFGGRFRSLDMYPESLGSRRGDVRHAESTRFFDQQLAYEFAMSIETAASTLAFRYQILYDDYAVIREFNQRAKNGHMSIQDNVEKSGGRPQNLNWHGPLVTHFHVDFAF